MERDYQAWAVPSSSNAEAVENVEEVVDKPATERRATAEVDEMPVTAREIHPNLEPREAWSDPAEDRRRQDAAMEKFGKQSKNARGKQPLWMTRTKRFCHEVSVVGLRYVASPLSSPFRRSVWVLLLLAGVAFTMFQIQNRIGYFLSRPVSVNLRIEHVEEIRFPTVTICNENRVTYSSAAYFGKYRVGQLK